MATAPRPGATTPQLEPLLGAEGCARLQRALIARAARWAARTGAPYVAYAPAGAHDEIAGLVPADATLFAQAGGHAGERLAAAFAHVSELHDGPVLVVGTDQPGLSDGHARAAADDLRAGIDVTLGPATSGGYYLLGARRFHRELFEIDAEEWGGPRVMELTLRALHEAGLSMGWLRSERDLVAPADAAALLADPCAPAEIRDVLAASVAERG
jgi:glycosyltransferase A (GT-A) superfamily protein (DUF2064 family)